MHRPGLNWRKTLGANAERAEACGPDGAAEGAVKEGTQWTTTSTKISNLADRIYEHTHGWRDDGANTEWRRVFDSLREDLERLKTREKIGRGGLIYRHD